jgi:hypothetical protein
MTRVVLVYIYIYIFFIYMNCKPICMKKVVLTGEMDYFPSQFSLLFSTLFASPKKKRTLLTF